jgi:hypothetical protein
MDKDKSPILEEVEKQMDIVPYTKRDRLVTLMILVIVFLNFVLLILTVPWGSVT